MDPRTFLPPRALPLVPAPEPGDPARRLPVTIEAGRPAIVAFLRHVRWCALPAHAGDLPNLASALEAIR